MMITVNRIGDSITGSYNGTPFGAAYSAEKYAAMKDLENQANTVSDMEGLKTILDNFELLTKENYKDLVEHKTPYLFVNQHTGQYFLKYNDKISTRALPKAFVDRIIHSVENGIDITPLVKCWVRFLRNMNYTDSKARAFANYVNQTYVNPELKEKLIEGGLSESVAHTRATGMQTPITMEGLICTYKVSKEITEKYQKTGDGKDVELVDRYDFDVDEFSGLKTYKSPEYVEDRVFQPAVMGQGGDAFFCGDTEGHVIRVGKTHFLDSWNKVNTNDATSCVAGLHCGNIDYIRCYQNAGTVTHDIFVDPMDIGAITNDGTGALRVIRYFVYRSFAGVNRSIYHSSTFAAITDTEYAKMVEAAVADSQTAIDAIADILAEKKALI